jgi:hypothetical protein
MSVFVVGVFDAVSTLPRFVQVLAVKLLLDWSWKFWVAGALQTRVTVPAVTLMLSNIGAATTTVTGTGQDWPAALFASPE